MVYSFKAQVAARGFHVYRNNTWTDVKQGRYSVKKMFLKILQNSQENTFTREEH